MKTIALALIRFYQLTISKVLPSNCRYLLRVPSITYDAIIKFGIFKGIWLGMKRIARCHPGTRAGMTLSRKYMEALISKRMVFY